MPTLWTKIQLLCLKYFISTFRMFYHWFLTVLFFGRKFIVPPVNDPILFKSAVTLASEIRQGKTKSEDVVMSYVKRIKKVNPHINAICAERFETAFEEARQVDELIASHTKTARQLEEEKPLLGIPFTTKILVSVKGMPRNGGSLLHKDVEAYEDAEAVERMKNAGAICLAITNASEFGLYFETSNYIYGRTSNPYDTRRTAGGSSGGEGALIGSGGSLIGIGSDFGGSIRLPSYFNGIFGHKPTTGFISNEGSFPVPPEKLSDFLTIGPMCRYAEDLALATKIMCCQDLERAKLNKVVNFSKLKIFYILDDGDFITSKVSAEVKDSILKAVHYFQTEYGISAKEVKLKGLQNALITYAAILYMSADKKDMEESLTAGKLQLNPTHELIKFIFGQSNLCFGTIACLNFPMIHNAQKDPEMINRSELLREELEAILDENAVLILPSFISTAHYHYELISMILSTSFLPMLNILQLPVTQCPIGLSADGLPLGFQIAGAKGHDYLTLACASEIEQAFGGWVPPNSNQAHLK